MPLVRFGEFEFLKACAIIGLPIVHVMEEAMDASLTTPGLEAFGTSILGLCVFGPSIFMICMGFGIGGGKTSADSIRKSGIQFLLIGLFLNIFRWLIPGIIKSLVLHTPLIEDIDLCFQSDIYYFVGIFFVFYAFLKKRGITTAKLLLLSMIMLTLNTVLTPVMSANAGKNDIISSLVGNILYVNDTSCFPLFSWAIFPTMGIIFGEVLKANDDEFREYFMRRVMDFSIVFFVSFVIFLWNYNLDALKILVSPNNDYITDLPNVLMLISMACFVIGAAYYLCKAIGHTKFMAFMLKISTFIIPFYLLQWVLVSWLIYGCEIFRMPEQSFGIPAYLISVVVITALCIYVASQHGMKIMKVLLKYTTFKKKKKKTVKAAEATAKNTAEAEKNTEAGNNKEEAGKDEK